MRYLVKSALIGAVALAAIAAAPASATDYVYSYTFDTGDTVSGSFTGTGPVTAITDIANATLSIDGTPISGISVSHYYGYMGPTGSNCDTCYLAGGALVSSDPLLENFLFDNGTDYFYIIPWNNGPGNQVATQAVGPGGVIDYYNGSYLPGNFSIVAVPEISTWGMMLAGFGMVGFAMRGRRRRVTATYA